MRALGNMKDAIEFEDLTKDDIEAKKNFGEMIKRCDEMKKKNRRFSPKMQRVQHSNINHKYICRIKRETFCRY